jgi:hypothetical protein
MDSPSWLTRFSDAALQAEHYRVGRVLLAGDAAHVHFPAGGQGVNLGLQDAVNLGWKLAAEVHGWAPPGLLDTYETERAPVAEAVLENVRAQVTLMDPDPRMDALRTLFARMMHLDDVNQYLGGMISGVDVRYETGHLGDPLVGHFAPDVPLKTGDSVTSLAELLWCAMPLLLLLADSEDFLETVGPWRPRVNVVTATATEPVGTDALLVRPDGYIAWSALGNAGDVDALAGALRCWFGDPTQEVTPWVGPATFEG